MNSIIKALIPVTLIVCILMTLASCEESETSTPTTTPTDDISSSTESETTKPSNQTSNTTDDTSSMDEPHLDKPFKLACPNIVLLDSNGVKLTALDFSEETSETYITIDVRVENNNTHGVNIMLNSLTVNGYLISGKLDSFVTKAGADQIVPFTISKRDIEFAEIDEIREILVSFYAKDENYKSFISPVEPVSLKTTKFDTPTKELDTSGVLAYTENDILIVVKEDLYSDNRYIFAKLLIKNSSDSAISVSCNKLIVNGKELSNSNCIRYGRVPSGAISYNSMDIEKSELEKLGIEAIETIEMSLKVQSAEDWTLIAEDLTVIVDYK